MRWQQGRRSTNVENRQRLGGKAAAGGGLGLLALALIVGLMGGDPAPLVQEGIERTIESHMSQKSTLNEEENKELTDFVASVLGSTEDVWGKEFAKEGEDYPEPTLVLFTGVVDSACGRAGSATGPFYCSRDQKIYIDLGFYHDLKTKMNAPGDFAQAYVIAHEVGHHVQNIVGILDEVHTQQSKMPKAMGNILSVRLELQADCFSGVWAKSVQDDYDMIEAGDIDEALNAASQIGDDRLQQQAQGYVVPDSFTHGTSAQRKKWFKRGFKQGSLEACNTFSTEDL